jgi:DNA-binding LacI/PurR family transcriptional regulator
MLAAEFEVSRPTIRKALLSLVESGVLVNAPGVGTRISTGGEAPAAAPGGGKIIALALPDISNRFFIEVTEAIEYALLQRGYQLLLSNYRHQPGIEEMQVRQFARRRVDGMILAHDAPQQLPLALGALEKAGIPIVLLFSAPAEARFDAVILDERAGVEQVLRYLYSLGHQRIAFCRPLADGKVHPREAAFREVTARAGLALAEEYILPFQALEEGRGALEKLLALAEPPTAIFAGNDRVALMVLKHLSALGVRVPEEISLAGFDNLLFTEHLPVPLTTVDQPKAAMGRRAVEMLLERVEMDFGPEIRREVFQPHLVIRDSCGMAGVAGK